MTTRISERWHMKDSTGRIFIMYGVEDEIVNRAILRGYTDIQRSGHYCYETNTIVGALDGSTVIYEGRSAPGA